MKKILIVLLIGLVSNSVYSADVILFQDNFDDHADWQSPEQDFSSGSDDSDSTGDATTRCASCPPDGAIYSGMYSARASWPDYRGNRTINISSANARGGTGKALTFWMEPVNSSSCDGGTYWCSDGQLSISLSEPVQNITVEYYVKFDTNYGWDSTNDAAKQKMIHLTNMNESLGYSRWDFFYPMNHNALTLFTVQDTTYYGDTGFAIRMHPRYQSGYKENIPSEWLVSNDYDRQYASGGTGTSGHKTFAELVGDNDWHKVTYTLIGNSALGQADGSYSIAIDDVVIVERTTVEWADTPYWSGCETCINPPQNFIGWNYITIGGNMYNRRDDLSVKEEIYYAVDDLVITTDTDSEATFISLQEDFSTSESPTTYTGTASAATGQTITGVVSSNGYTVTPDDGTWDEQVEAFTVSGVIPTVTDTCTATDSSAETGQDSITVTLTSSIGTTVNGFGVGKWGR